MSADFRVVVHHNPDCGTSRNVLAKRLDVAPRPPVQAGLVDAVEGPGVDDRLDSRDGQQLSQLHGGERRVVGKSANSFGVTRFTRRSVHCAERMTATSSSSGEV